MFSLDKDPRYLDRTKIQQTSDRQITDAVSQNDYTKAHNPYARASTVLGPLLSLDPRRTALS